MSWTEEKVERLKKLWAEGLTTGEIGRALDMSKNAVVGKAHRLGLESRPSPIKRDEESISKKEDSKLKKANFSKQAKSVEDFVTLTDLTLHSCRWPIGDPKDKEFHFCGKEAILGKPYCAEHIMVAYVGINKK